MNKVNLTIGIAAVVLAGFSFIKPVEVAVNVPQQSAPVVNVQAPEVNVPATVVNVPKQEAKLGAVATLDGINSPYVSINGSNYYYYRQNIAATSSTVCSIRNPFPQNKRFSVIDYSVDVTSNGIAVAQSITLSTSTDQFLVGTGPNFLHLAPVGAGAFNLSRQGNSTTTVTNYLWGNDGVAGVNYATVGPSEYLNLKISSTTPGTFASYWSGTCTGIFKQL